MNLLFVCRHNCYRSRVAEEYMKKISTYSVDSAGIVPSIYGPLQDQIEVAKLYGLDIVNKAKGLSAELLNKQDFIINTADDVPSYILIHPDYNRAKIITWNIPDIKNGDTKEDIAKTIKHIMAKVEELKIMLEINLKKNEQKVYVSKK